MTARDVLREAIEDAYLDSDTVSEMVDAIKRDLRDNAPAVLALLAEPKVCERCGGRGTDPYPEPCDPTRFMSCWMRGCEHGRVAVDVLDLLVQAGRLERRDVVTGVNTVAVEVRFREVPAFSARHCSLETEGCDDVPKDGTP